MLGQVAGEGWTRAGRAAGRSGERALLRGKRCEEDPGPGLRRGKVVGYVPAPRSRRPQSSGPGVGTRRALRVQARRGDTWPKESDTGAPLGTLGSPGSPSSPRTPRFFWFPEDAGLCWAKALGPGAV